MEFTLLEIVLEMSRHINENMPFGEKNKINSVLTTVTYVKMRILITELTVVINTRTVFFTKERANYSRIVAEKKGRIIIGSKLNVCVMYSFLIISFASLPWTFCWCCSMQERKKTNTNFMSDNKRIFHELMSYRPSSLWKGLFIFELRVRFSIFAFLRFLWKFSLLVNYYVDCHSF